MLTVLQDRFQVQTRETVMLKLQSPQHAIHNNSWTQTTNVLTVLQDKFLVQIREAVISQLQYLAHITNTETPQVIAFHVQMVNQLTLQAHIVSPLMLLQ